MQAELDRCRETITSCAQAMTPQGLRELRSLRKPPGAVSSILEATAVLLGAVEAQQARRAAQGALPEKNKEVELDPREVRKALQGNLPERLREIDLEEVTPAQFRRLRKLLALPGFGEEHVRGVCPAAVPLAVLCCAVGACLVKTRGCGGCEAGPAEPAPTANARVRAPFTPRGGSEVPAAGGPSPLEASPAPQGGVAKLEGGLLVRPDITRLGPRELQQVSDLTVNRPEVGCIVFHGITDCTDLDITSLVHLALGEVLVYPQGSKPVPGQGLNKRATVTMYQCWPPNGRGNLEDASSQERYRAKIKQMTEEKRATFIDYDCTSGIWKFQVEHF